MKRLLITAGVLAASVALCVAGAQTTLHYTGNLETALSQARSAGEAGDWQAAYRLSQQAQQGWQDAHAVLCTFQQHNRLEALEQVLTLLPDLAKYEAQEQFASECARAQLMNVAMREGELPMLQNIL